MIGRAGAAPPLAAPRPTVLILGGYLTAPPLYWPLRRRLLARGAAAVVIGNVWTPDWLLVGVHGLGPIATRAGRALLRAGQVSAASPLSRGAPVLVIGHSAGGIVARILTAPEAFAGRRFGAVHRIGAIVTLGSPNRVNPATQLGARLDAIAADFVESVVPGALHAPRIGYVAVASRAIAGRPAGTGRERVAARTYASLAAAPGPDALVGDGLVPLASALLDGATNIVLDDALHGHGSGEAWYGAEGPLDAWWPTAIEAWRCALEARSFDALDEAR